MPVTNTQSGTRIDEVAEGIYRICTPLPPTVVPGGFSFNQYLVDDEEPLLFHTGPRGMFALTSEAIASVMPVSRLRHVAFSHFESDECGAGNEFLAAAPRAAILCGRVSGLVNADVWSRPPRALADGETVSLGKHLVRWIDAAHVPHGWDCGYLFEERTRTLLCGDLFTQGGAGHDPRTQADILAPSEAFRKAMDYYAHGPNTGQVLAKLAATKPAMLACMHGSAWQGDGEGLLKALAGALSA